MSEEAKNDEIDAGKLSLLLRGGFLKEVYHSMEESYEIRKVIYTTNAVENLHRQFRKVTKNRALFPNDEALTKMIYLAYRDIAKK